MDFVLALIASSLVMCLAWVFFMAKKNPSIVDLFWPISILSSSAVLFFAGDDISLWSYVCFLAVFAWSSRLFFYLFFTRFSSNHKDKRYDSISEKWTGSISFKFFANFQFQSLAGFIVSIPFFFIPVHQKIISLSGVFFLCVVFAGVLGESIADYQLYMYKLKNPGSVCRSGLWSLCRHPNLFFDWLVWVGFSLSGFSGHGLSFVSFLSPIFLYFVMVKLTCPVTEKVSIRSKGAAYIEYQNKTPIFFPRINFYK